VELVTSGQHRRCIIPQAANTVIAPEDGRNYPLKHVELIEIINNKIIIVVSIWLFIKLFIIHQHVYKISTVNLY
jgi:hypothetical protein